MNKTLKITLVVVGAVALSVGGYFIYKRYSKKTDDKGVSDKVNAQTKKSNKIVFTR